MKKYLVLIILLILSVFSTRAIGQDRRIVYRLADGSLTVVLESKLIIGGFNNVLVVSSDSNAIYHTIQSALDSAEAGDVILVSPGEYNESLTFKDDSVAVIGMGSKHTTIVYQEDSTVVNFGAYDNCYIDNMSIRLTAPTDTVNMITGTGRLVVHDCMSEVIITDSLATASKLAMTTGGIIRFDKGGIYYTNFASGIQVSTIKAAFSVGDGGLIEVGNTYLILVNNTGACLVTALFVDGATTGEFYIHNNNSISINDSSATHVVGFGYLGGSGVVHRIVYNKIYVNALKASGTNNAYGIWVGGSTDIHLALNHIHVTSTASLAYGILTSASATGTSHFDDIVAADGNSIGGGVFEYVNSIDDGWLEASQGVKLDTLASINGNNIIVKDTLNTDYTIASAMAQMDSNKKLVASNTVTFDITFSGQLTLSDTLQALTQAESLMVAGVTRLMGALDVSALASLDSVAVAGILRVIGDADLGNGGFIVSAGDSSITFVIGTSVNEFSTDGTLAGNSDDAVPTEQAVKTYVDLRQLRSAMEDSVDAIVTHIAGDMSAGSGAFMVTAADSGVVMENDVDIGGLLDVDSTATSGVTRLVNITGVSGNSFTATDTIDVDYTSASMAVVTDANKKLVAHADVSAAEIGRLDNTDFNIKTEVDGKMDLSVFSDSVAAIDSTYITNDKLGFEDINNLPEALALKQARAATRDSIIQVISDSLLVNLSELLAQATIDSAYARAVAGDSSGQHDQMTEMLAGNHKIYYSGGDGAVVELTLGANNTVLKGEGVSSAPTFGQVTVAEVTGAMAAADMDDSLAAHVADSLTGAISTIYNTDLTASRVTVSNGSGKIEVSDITTTELDYLNNTDFNIKTEVDAKAALSVLEDSVKAIVLDLDSLNLKITLPHLDIGFGGWSTYQDFKPDLVDTVEFVAKMDTINGGLYHILYANMYDTSHVLNKIDLWSDVIDIPVWSDGLDSVVGDFKTGINDIDSNYVKLIAYEVVDGAYTFLDSTASLANAATWTHDATITTLGALTRYDKFILRVEFASMRNYCYAVIGRLKLYWKVKS